MKKNQALLKNSKAVQQIQCFLFTVIFLSSGIIHTVFALPAFPGAEGFGSTTPGGRGGKVIEVTNLKNSGAGSLRAAIEAKGARIVVFRTSGTIPLESDLVIKNPNITIAGQTAPGDGICLQYYKLMISTKDVIVRHIRIRRGLKSGKEDDGLGIDAGENIIIDHCSVSWTTDEVVNTWHGAKNITIQWSIFSEGLHNKDHGFAATLGGVNASYHHNLLANCPGRNPSVGGNHVYQTHNMDYRNNVTFNWGYRTIDGKPSSINVVNNYFRPGSNSTRKDFGNIDDPTKYQAIGTTKWYVSGNFMEGMDKINQDNKAGLTGELQWMVSEPNEFAPVKTVSAEEVYPLVLADVGATKPKRDPVDKRIIQEVTTGKNTYGKGIVNSEKDVGGWPALASTPAPPDSDHDGMPDTWEKEHNLDPNNASDGSKDRNGDGYTNIEEYINELAGSSATPVLIKKEFIPSAHLQNLMHIKVCANGRGSVSLDNYSENIVFSIFDLNGTLVSTGTINNTVGYFSMTNKRSGTYILHIENPGLQKTFIYKQANY